MTYFHVCRRRALVFLASGCEENFFGAVNGWQTEAISREPILARRIPIPVEKARIG
jgi:hypothetical protein